MAKAKITGHLLAYHFSHMEAGKVVWGFSEYHSGKTCDEIVAVVPHSFEVDVPEVNVVAARVSNLQAAEAKALEDYQQRVAQIREQLSKLLALESA
jgi:hypothetical protein